MEEIKDTSDAVRVIGSQLRQILQNRRVVKVARLGRRANIDFKTVNRAVAGEGNITIQTLQKILDGLYPGRYTIRIVRTESDAGRNKLLKFRNDAVR